MPENWVDWARLIGTLIGATVIAIVASWQIYVRLIRPLIKRFEPIINEIKGPGDEPGLRQLIYDVGDTAKSALHVGIQSNEGVNALRRDFQAVAAEHVDLRRDVGEIKGSQKEQGQRIGSLEQAHGELKGRVDTIERLHVERGCFAPAPRAEVTEEGQKRTGAGAGTLENLAPTPPRPESVPERKR